MPPLNVKDLKRALNDAGLEVFRVKDQDVLLAERQNIHLMDSGIRVRATDPLTVIVIARAQRNDAPTLQDAAFYAAVRTQLQPLFDVGYVEDAHGSRELRSVSDQTQVLDVWYEITLKRDVLSLEEAFQEVRRALAVDRYVVPR